jgi:hypothetical protein
MEISFKKYLRISTVVSNVIMNILLKDLEQFRNYNELEEKLKMIGKLDIKHFLNQPKYLMSKAVALTSIMISKTCKNYLR